MNDVGRVIEDAERTANAALDPGCSDLFSKEILARWVLALIPLARAAERVEETLVGMYRLNPGEIARLCDKEIDRSGALLGRVRERATPMT